jgi:hypothetical protein
MARVPSTFERYISLDRLDAGELAQLCRIARQSAYGVAAFEQGSGDVPADEAGGSCHERGLHEET